MIIKKKRIFTIFICIALNVSVFFLCFVDENILCFPECSFFIQNKKKIKKYEWIEKRKCRRKKEKKMIKKKNEKKIHLSFKKLKRKEKFKINWWNFTNSKLHWTNSNCFYFYPFCFIFKTKFLTVDIKSYDYTEYF